MDKYTETIDFINAYLNKQLSEADRQAFESRLQTNNEFKELYNEHLVVLEGIKRAQLTAEIKKAKQNYIRTKWMKYIGIPIGTVLVSILVYNFIFKTETSQFVAPTTNNTEVVLDSLVTEKPSEEKKEIETLIVVEKPEANIVLEEKKIIKKDPVTVQKNQNKKKDTLLNNKGELKVGKLKPKDPELVAFYKSVKKEPQIIEVNTEKEFTVTCKEGTKLIVPAKSFVDIKTGRLVRGKINLEVTEYYKLSEMLLENLTTKSDEKVLETGGMLYLGANKKGSKLKLKSGKSIKVTFNNKGKRHMQLFYGEEGHAVNWQPQSELEIEFIEEDVEVALNVVENVPVFPGCDVGDNNEKRKCMDDKINRFFSKKFDKGIAKTLKLTGTHKISIFFKINKNGDIIDAIARAAHIKLAQEAIRLVDLLPKMIPGKQRGKAVRVPYYASISFKVEGSNIYRRNNIEATSIKMSKRQIDSLGIEKVNPKDIVRYAFSSKKLGWINCDRFARMKNRKRYKLKIENFDGADVKLVYKSMNAILPSKNYGSIIDFGWISGKEEEVLLIAIKKKKDELYLGIEERKTSDASALDFNFKKVSIDELKDELSELDALFN